MKIPSHFKMLYVLFGVFLACKSLNSTSSIPTEVTPTPVPTSTVVPTAIPNLYGPPVSNQTPGKYPNAISVELSSLQSSAVIRYTLNGSEPTASSTIYSSALSTNQNRVIRAKAFFSDGTSSDIATFTYLIGQPQDTFMVVCLTADPVALFDPLTGIYPNYQTKTEIPAHIEFFETDGSLVLSQKIGIELSGTGSLVNAQKSFELKAKSSYGKKTFEYPMFSDLPQINAYKRLLLRNSGQDWNVTQLRDAFVSSLVRDVSDVKDQIELPKINHQAYRPAVAFINGEYWGIYELREKMDESWVETHTALKSSQFDMISSELDIKTGTIDEWNTFQSFLLNNNFSQNTNYQALQGQVDLDRYIDYLVFQIYIDNADWPGNNNVRFREKTSGAKWDWLVKDLDFSFGLFVKNGPWNSGDPSQNSLLRALNDTGFDHPNPEWSTRLFRKALENSDFKNRFINRMADMSNLLFEKNRANTRLNAFQTAYTPHIQRHFDKWAMGFNPWLTNLDVLRTFGNGRLDHLKNHMQAQFTQITGNGLVTLTASPAQGGIIQWNTIKTTPTKPSFQGYYYYQVPISVKAIPASGYRFDHWSDTSFGTGSELTVTLSQPLTLTAYFVPQ